MTTVNIQKMDEAKLAKILKVGGYANFPEFVRDAARRRAEELEKEVA